MRAALAAAVLAALLATPVLAQQPPATPAETIVRIPFPQDDGTLTPYTFELGYALMTLVYDTLLWRDAGGVPQPWLAESVQVGADGLDVTLRLRAGARWHDGQPVVAEDVAFTFAFVAERFHPRFTPQLSAVERVDVVDPATVRIRLRHPSPGFADQPLSDLPILPRHLWADLPPDRLAPDGLPVGSGPYRLAEHRAGEGYRFAANRDHVLGAPAVDVLDVTVIGEAGATFQALEQREVDMIPVRLPPDAEERLTTLGIAVATGPSYLGTTLLLNTRRPPFDQPETRRAVAGALDLDRLGDAVGGVTPADHGYLHPASSWAPAAALHQGDPAPQLAGLPPLRVLAADNDPARLEAGRQVVLALERAGASAELVPLSRDALGQAVGEDDADPDFDAAIWHIPPLASYDPDFLRQLFGTGAALNDAGYANPAFDALADRVAATADPAARQAAVDEQLALLAADAPAVPLFFADGAYAYRPAVHDGWVYVRGSGILDKRSFLPAAAPSPEPTATTPAPAPPAAPATPRRDPPAATAGGPGPLGMAALGLVGVAGLMALVGLMRGGVRRR